jgi:hypothetical protein
MKPPLARVGPYVIDPASGRWHRYKPSPKTGVITETSGKYRADLHNKKVTWILPAETVATLPGWPFQVHTLPRWRVTAYAGIVTKSGLACVLRTANAKPARPVVVARLTQLFRKLRPDYEASSPYIDTPATRRWAGPPARS